MSIFDDAKQDWEELTQEVSITFVAPTAETATILGIAVKHSINVDPESGELVDSENIHVSVSESLLIAENYPTRVDGEIFMNNHKISYADSSGVSGTYIVQRTFPDSTVGIITLILGTYS